MLDPSSMSFLCLLPVQQNEDKNEKMVKIMMMVVMMVMVIGSFACFFRFSLRRFLALNRKSGMTKRFLLDGLSARRGPMNVNAC